MNFDMDQRTYYILHNNPERYALFERDANILFLGYYETFVTWSDTLNTLILSIMST